MPVAPLPPSTLTLAGSKAQNFSLAVATEAPQTGLLRTLGTTLAGVLLLLPLPWWKRRGRGGTFCMDDPAALDCGIIGLWRRRLRHADAAQQPGDRRTGYLHFPGGRVGWHNDAEDAAHPGCHVKASMLFLLG